MKLLVVSALTALVVTSVAWSADRLTPNEFVMKASEARTAEVEPGKLAALKSNAPEAKAFGERMVADHTMPSELGAAHAAH